MDKNKNGFVNYESFKDLVKLWGFDANEQNMREIFDWLDKGARRGYGAATLHHVT